MGRVLLTLHLLLYFAEISLIIFLLTMFLQDSYWRITFCLLLFSSFLCNISSYARIGQTMDFYHKPCGLFTCALLHILQLGLLWRYIKMLILYENADSRDFMCIRLLHTCSCSIPVLLCVVSKYLDKDEQPFYVILAAVCFVSSILTFATFSQFNENIHQSISAVLSTLLWRTFTLFSRLSALTLCLVSIHGLWALMVLGAHFIVLMIWYQLREQSKQDKCTRLRMWLLVLSFADTIDLTIASYKIGIEWLVGYYATILCESTIIVVIRYASLEQPYKFQDALWLVTVFASLALGLLLSLITMVLSVKEQKKTTLQKTLKCCCPGSRRGHSDKLPYAWDSYETKRKPTCYANKAFEFEERQKHVDIINNPLGVSDVVSLGANTTPGVSSPHANKSHLSSPLDPPRSLAPALADDAETQKQVME